MAMAVQCPKCGASWQLRAAPLGRQGRCPRCQELIPLPGAQLDAATRSKASADTTAPRAAWPARAQLMQVLETIGRQAYQPPAVSLAYKLLTWPVAAVVCLLPLVYLATAAALVGGWMWVWLWAREHGWSLVAQTALGLVGLIVLLGLLKPLVVPARRGVPRLPLHRSQEKLLWAWIEQLTRMLGTPVPEAIALECSTDVRVCGARGWLVHRPGELTLGLPLLASLKAEELLGLVARELAPYRRGAARGRVGLIRGLHGWAWRGVFEQDRWDQWLARKTRRPGWHVGKCLLPLHALQWITRAMLFVPMFLADTLAGPIVRRALLDADRCTARLCGRRSWRSAVARERIAAFQWEGLLAELDFLAREQRLPDSLPHELMQRMAEVTPELGTALLETVARPVEQLFDSRPDDAQRQSAVADADEQGPLAAGWPAWLLLEHGVECARRLTRELYHHQLGPAALQTQFTDVVRSTPWNDLPAEASPVRAAKA